MSGASPREEKAGIGKRRTLEKCACHMKGAEKDNIPTTNEQQPAIAR